MSKKAEFINWVEKLIAGQEEPIEPSAEAAIYWEAFKSKQDEAEKPEFTDNGKLILQYMQDHQEVSSFRAKDIGEGLFVSSRTVSGSIRKLVTDGYVEKVGQDPVMYALTALGKDKEIN